MNSSNEVLNIDELPKFTPPMILGPIDHVGEFYFSFLGINSLVKDNQEIVFPIWDPTSIISVSPDLNMIRSKTIEGKGPGEIIDAGRPAFGINNKIMTYDQRQSRITIWDNELNLLQDMVTPSINGYRLRYVLGEFEDGKLLIDFGVSGLDTEGAWDSKFVVMDPEIEQYGQEMEVNGKPYSPVNGGAIQVPFANSQLIAYMKEKATFLIYDTNSDVIAEINSNLDTLRTIKSKLPRLEISRADFDTLNTRYDLIKSEMDNLLARLPELKAPATSMLYDDGQIWLKSTQVTEYDQWYVMDMTGEVMGLVNLPTNTYLTHVSNEHIGVRLDESTIALFENPIEVNK